MDLSNLRKHLATSSDEKKFTNYIQWLKQDFHNSATILVYWVTIPITILYFTLETATWGFN